MPGLLRGVARTAVVAGTATAVSGRVQRRQAEKYAERDANIYAQREQAYYDQQAPPPQQGYAAQEAAPPPPAPAEAPAPSSSDTIAQLKELAELKAQGILTDEEFAAQKAKILGT
ncbi:Short C-terminal domain-containing protein [Pedococcus cremeus]|uniref:Short C-terminal domain-containing protein n=1 Tax=Pedococcus cremeus TaxID=587636 RepID=A0A1H9XGZ5_9MICO|nr:SHOCT domain-containing protein [Pedococcus cremeus]SES44913.1 Short C-terminal domain-containing protein [Pedococcus cremeus]